jgi:DNA modification methylase
MQKKASYNLLPLSEGPTESDEILQLRKRSLLNSLAPLSSSDSLESLRLGVLGVKELILTADSDLRSNVSPDESIEFTTAHLSSEFQQIVSSQTLERAVYYVERLMKSIAEVRTNEVNDINLNRWKEYSDIYLDSLWQIERRDDSGAHTAGYWGNFVPQIPYQMMRRYTRKGDWVLDAFVGCGTTLIEGRRLGRNTIGIELQSEIAEKARSIVARESNDNNVVSEIVVGDSSTIDYPELMRRFDKSSVQLVILHPPYWDIIRFSDDPRDLSNASSIDSFLETMGRVIDKAADVLDKGRYLVLVIGDKYAKGEWVPLGFRTMNEVLSRGFILKSIIVKNFEETTGKRQQKELWRYRALVGGFYIFKHEYVIVFRKN